MTGKDLRQLEKDLAGDLVHSDKAVLERVRKQVKEFLLHEAGLLVGAHVRDEKQIVDLIQLHARVNLLRALVENPRGFSMKDQKELFKSVGELKGGDQLSKPVNPLALIESLDVSPQQKAQLVEGMVDVMRGQLRAKLGRSDAP